MRNKTSKPRRGLSWRAWAGMGSALALVAGVVIGGGLSLRAEESPIAIPAPALDLHAPATSHLAKVVLAGGCFWGVQAVFQHVKGVERAVSGYAGGTGDTASYAKVSAGDTGHAEAVEITYDPATISYGKILQIYFSVAHNPTELNRQGPDRGRQYRSTVFAADGTQKDVAAAYIAQLDRTGLYKKPIATTIERLNAFYPAEAYHQDYATLHPSSPYIAFNDLPKITNLSTAFPDLYRPEVKLINGGARSN